MPVKLKGYVGTKLGPKEKDPDPADVKQVQSLLAQVQCGPGNGGPIAINGNNADTVDAIKRFQGFFPGAGANGRIDPNSRTLRRLVALAAPLNLAPITRKSFRVGGYSIAYDTEVPTSNYQVKLCVTAQPLATTARVTMQTRLDVTRQPRNDLIDASNMEDLLGIIGRLKLWQNDAYITAVVAVKKFFLSEEAIISRSASQKLTTPVQPYRGPLGPELGKQDDGPPLVYSGVLDGRMLHPTPLASAYFYVYNGQFEISEAKRGLNCITYCGAAFGVDSNTGAMSGDGQTLANYLQATECDPVMHKKTADEVKAFFKAHPKGTYIMWLPGAGQLGHCVLVVDATVHEFRPEAPVYNQQSIEQWDFRKVLTTPSWWVRKAPRDF